MSLNNKVYDALKWITMIALPAFSAFYFLLAGVWNLPLAGEVVATLAGVTTLLGALLGLSTAKYNKTADGTVTISQDNTVAEPIKLNVDHTLEGLMAKSSITLKVVKQ